MPNRPRKLPGGKGEREEYERRFGRPYEPARVMGPERCEDLHPSEYVAGINYYCDGTASRSGRRHRREVVGRFRHSTCEKAAAHDDREPWMVALERVEEPMAGTPVRAVHERLPRDDDRTDYDGPPRYRLLCNRCTFNHVLTEETLRRVMAEVWVEHARNAEPRNVATLLT